MKIDSDTVPLGVRISRIMIEGKVRFIVQNRLTLQPLIAISLYEAYLSKRHASYNSVLDTLQKLSYLWCWAQQSNVDLDEILLTGEMLTPQQVNSFGSWLDQRKTLRNKSSLSPKTKNGILNCVSKSFKWFADQFYKTLRGPASEREVFMRQYKDAISDRFSDKQIKTRKKNSAEDLTEEEITKIEYFLKPENRLLKQPYLSKAQALRDYLIWRLVIEFGLRIGEILALRLEDCPHQHQDFIKIVRVEERGANYRDPRGAYAPRPKTLSRELGFILKNSPIKRLINEYTTKHRFRKVLEHGRKVSKPVFDMPAFLILNHKHEKGTPLSISAASDLAGEIRRETGIDHFHWHIGRHAFFNRAYAGAVEAKNNDHELRKERIRDLVFWGGWESENSLQLYINRARRHRAQTALSFYQMGQAEWEALN